MNKLILAFLAFLSLAYCAEADFTAVGYGFYDISGNYSMMGLGVHTSTDALVCSVTFGYQPFMTPDGLIITRYTNALTTWFAQLLNLSAPVYCIKNTTAYATTQSGSIFNIVSTTSTGNLSLNHTNVPINSSIKVYSVLYLVNGSNITTEVRQYYIIGQSTQIPFGGEDMGGILITLGIAWAIFWLTALWLYETKRLLFAYCAYLAGFFALFTGLFVAIDTTSTTNPATANFLQMFVFPMTWALVGSVIALILYIFIGTLVKMAGVFHIKIADWWYDGKM